MNMLHAYIAAGALVLSLAAPLVHAQADRADADVRCAPAAEKLVFDCTLRLTNRRTGAPLEGARITVHAEMPSMPMAHNVRPVQVEPAGQPGLYRLRIALEMPGVWSLRLNISGPLNDVVVTRMDFNPTADAGHSAMDGRQGDASHGSADSGQQRGGKMQMPADHGGSGGKDHK